MDGGANEGTRRVGLSQTPAATSSNASVNFLYPRSGAILYPRTTIRIALRNAGASRPGANKQNACRNHLLIDVDPPPPGKVIPNDRAHRRFSSGQTEKKITMKPGKHKLQLICADYRHLPHDPPVMSERIEVTVVRARRHRRWR